MNFKKTLAAVALALSTTSSAAFAAGHGEITVGYFLEWPMPFQAAKVAGTYDEALGVKVNWVSFDTGTAMSAAMASGDVQISVSQGVPPFVVAASAGQDIQILDVAVSYSDNDNCVVRSDLEIDKDSAGELAGKKVAVPLGTAAHFGFLSQMNHFGIDTASMEIVDMAPQEGQAALAQGAVDMACGWGGALRRMKEHGNVLLTGAEKEELGILVFDATSAPANFVAEEGELLAKFLKVTADMNARYAQDSAPMMPEIAKAAGMDAEGTAAVMSVFGFPTLEQQLSDDWMGGFVAKYLADSAAKLEEAGQIKALDDYAPLVNSSYLDAASKM